MAKGYTDFGKTPGDPNLVRFIASGKVALNGNEWIQIDCDGKTENAGLGIASLGSEISYNGLYDVVNKDNPNNGG